MRIFENWSGGWDLDFFQAADLGLDQTDFGLFILCLIEMGSAFFNIQKCDTTLFRHMSQFAMLASVFVVKRARAHANQKACVHANIANLT